MGTCLRIAALGIVLSFAIGGQALAAPQILGLLATAAPAPLTCRDGVCSAQFSAFCLQQNKPAPTTGTAYRPADGTALTLAVTGRDGVMRTLPADPLVTIEALREFHAVRIAIAEDDVRALGGKTAAIGVGAHASLVPVARPGARTALDAREIAYVTGPYRKAVDAVLDTESTVAAQTVSRLISALPQGRTTAGKRGRLWRDVMGDAPTPSSHAGLRRAERDYLYCKRWADSGRGYGLRDCLESTHDAATSDITNKAWAVSQPGS